MTEPYPTASAYVRRVCDAKGPSDEPVLEESEYVRYVTGSRYKRSKRVLAGADAGSGDRVDEVL